MCILDNNRVLVYTPVIPDEFGLLGLTVYGLPVGLDIPVIPDIIYLNNILFNILY